MDQDEYNLPIDDTYAKEQLEKQRLFDENNGDSEQEENEDDGYKMDFDDDDNQEEQDANLAQGS